MKSKDWYEHVISKAYTAFLEQPNLDWDFPAYGGNLSKKEIETLSIEHVDAIQHAIGAAQERYQQRRETTPSCFNKDVKEAYETITPQNTWRSREP